jgi:hypothetical protein
VEASCCVATHRVPVPNDKWLQGDDPTKVRIQHLHQLPGGQAPHIQILPAEVECEKRYKTSMNITIGTQEIPTITQPQIVAYCPYNGIMTYT